MRCRSRSAGFTMVEMLVVVSIIALLATLVFMGVGTLQFRAHQSVCQQNLRSLTSGAMEYANYINGGRLPGFESSRFSVGGANPDSRSGDEWVWALGLVDSLYYSEQSVGKIFPPRSSHKVLRCPSDTNYVVNCQRALTSYYAEPIMSDEVLVGLIRRGETPFFFEADPVHLVGNCECRFQLTKSPKYAETYHDGGTNCGYLDGSVRWIHTELDRTIDSYYLYRMDGARRRFASPDKVYNWEPAPWTETPR